jgi:replicative DNA helicase
MNPNELLNKFNTEPFELVVIGTLLTDKEPLNLYEMVRKKLKPAMFSEQHKGIFSIICEMLECGESLRNYLIIEKAIQRKIEITPKQITEYRLHKTESDFTKTIDTLVSQWYEYNIAKNSIQFQVDLQSGMNPSEANEIFTTANNEIEEIKMGYNDSRLTLEQSALEYVQDVDKRRKSDNPLIGMSFGLKRLDDMTGGLQPALYLLPGAGGDGKTTLALNLANFLATDHPIDYYSLEMSTKQLTPKLLSSGTGVSRLKMVHANINDKQMEQLYNEVPNIAKKKLNIIDDIIDLTALLSSIRIRKKKYGIRAVFIDNRTNVQHKIKSSNFAEGVVKLTYVFKFLSIELDMPIILLVHKNKDSFGRSDKRPVNGDIAYGGDIAADFIMFPHRLPNAEPRPDGLVEGEIVITKNRLIGDEGYIPVLFDERFDSYFEEDNNGNIIHGYNPNNFGKTEKDTTPTPKATNNIITQRGNPEDLPF